MVITSNILVNKQNPVGKKTVPCLVNLPSLSVGSRRDTKIDDNTCCSSYEDDLFMVESDGQCYRHPATLYTVTRQNKIYNHKHELHNQKPFIYQSLLFTN